MKLLETSAGAPDSLGIEFRLLGSQGSTLVDRILRGLSQEHRPGDVIVACGLYQECS